MESERRMRRLALPRQEIVSCSIENQESQVYCTRKGIAARSKNQYVGPFHWHRVIKIDMTLLFL